MILHKINKQPKTAEEFMKYTDTIYYRVKSEAEYCAIYLYLNALGWDIKLNDERTLVEEAKNDFKHWPYVSINVSTKQIKQHKLHGILDGWTCLTTVSELFKHIEKSTKPQSVIVKLNDEYNAEITETHIKVGCQTFPITILDELNKARQELNK